MRVLYCCLVLLFFQNDWQTNEKDRKAFFVCGVHTYVVDLLYEHKFCWFSTSRQHKGVSQPIYTPSITKSQQFFLQYNALMIHFLHSEENCGLTQMTKPARKMREILGDSRGTATIFAKKHLLSGRWAGGVPLINVRRDLLSRISQFRLMRQIYTASCQTCIFSVSLHATEKTYGLYVFKYIVRLAPLWYKFTTLTFIVSICC